MPSRLVLGCLPFEEDWDSYGGHPTTDAAKRTAEALTVVPCPDGGIQLELHAGGSDVEIEIDRNGCVVSVLWANGG